MDSSRVLALCVAAMIFGVIIGSVLSRAFTARRERHERLIKALRRLQGAVRSSDGHAVGAEDTHDRRELRLAAWEMIETLESCR